MPSATRPSASVVAVGIVAVIGAAFAAIGTAFLLVTFQFAGSSASRAAIPPEVRPFLSLVWLFFLTCEAFVIVAGVQVIRLRNWARIAILVVAGCMLFFGIFGIGVIFFTIYLAPVDPAVSRAQLATALAFVYGIPLAVALWWVIVLTRRSVTEQFQVATRASLAFPAETGSATAGAFFNNPRCPLAIRIVGWYLASFVLFLPIVPFLPVRIPAYVLGHVFRGPSAVFVLFTNFVLISIPGIGLLLLKRWSFPLTIATQLLLCANGLFAVFSPSFESLMRETFSGMHLPDNPIGVETMFHYMRYFNLFGLLLPLAIVITLLLYRRAFFATADGAKSETSPSPNAPAS